MAQVSLPRFGYTDSARIDQREVNCVFAMNDSGPVPKESWKKIQILRTENRKCVWYREFESWTKPHSVSSTKMLDIKEFKLQMNLFFETRFRYVTRCRVKENFSRWNRNSENDASLFQIFSPGISHYDTLCVCHSP